MIRPTINDSKTPRPAVNDSKPPGQTVNDSITQAAANDSIALAPAVVGVISMAPVAGVISIAEEVISKRPAPIYSIAPEVVVNPISPAVTSNFETTSTN